MRDDGEDEVRGNLPSTEYTYDTVREIYKLIQEVRMFFAQNPYIFPEKLDALTKILGELEKEKLLQMNILANSL